MGPMSSLERRGMLKWLPWILLLLPVTLARLLGFPIRYTTKISSDVKELLKPQSSSFTELKDLMC